MYCVLRRQRVTEGWGAGHLFISFREKWEHKCDSHYENDLTNS